MNHQKGGNVVHTPAGGNGDDDISIHSSGEADHSEEYRDIDANPRNSKGNSNSESLSFTGPPFAGIVEVKIPFPNVIVIYRIRKVLCDKLLIVTSLLSTDYGVQRNLRYCDN